MTIAAPTLTTAKAARPQRIRLLDMPLDVVDFTDAVRRLLELAHGPRPAYVVTANVDHVVRYHRTPSVRDLYEKADMVVADGMPVIWASRLLGTPLPQRVAGSDLFPALCASAAERGLSVFFLGGAPGTAERCAAALTARHPRLRVVGTYCPDFGFESRPEENAKIVGKIRDARPNIVFVGLGSPKQEQWIATHREAYAAPLSLGIGISFSFLCGDVTRAPRWMQRMGLEWLHRLTQEPGRLWRRYLIEDSAFAWLVLRDKFRRR